MPESPFARIRRAALRLLNILVASIGRPDVPWYAKALGLTAAAYALSPLDLIPDFIPLLGFLDDALILPLLLAAAWFSIPRATRRDIERSTAEITDWKTAKAALARLLPRAGIPAAVIIVVIWLLCAFLLGKMILAR